ncbi:MAG: tetratricopeptide repeat protein [Acidobacteriia bacterium]|nr:tetratricopeptide repeat protein [Terriglobia bacterium]
MAMQDPELSSFVVRFGTFEADLHNGLLHRKGIRVKLQEQPFRILALLLERPGQVVTREAIRQALWPDGTFVDFDGGLNAAMKKLRVALNDASEKPQFIETIPKRGYRFIARVTQEAPEADSSLQNLDFGSLPANGARRSPTDGTTPRLAMQQSGQRITILLGIFLLVLAGIVAYRWHGHGRSAVATTEAAMKPIPTRRAAAVLGFNNVSGKPEDAWLSTALSEMMSTELAAGDKLHLVPGEDVSNLQLSAPWSQTDTLGQPTTSRIGTALNSDLLVLGSYTSVGGPGSRQLRLDVRLQDAKTGEILTEVAEIGSEQNLFQLVSRAGRRMRNRLGIPSLQQADEPSVFASMPANREAARFYALGLDRLRQFDAFGAAELLDQAVKADPKFSLAHSMLSDAWQHLGYGQRAKKEARKALDLSTNLSQTQKLLIEAHYYETLGQMEEAASDYHALYAYYPDCLECGLSLSAAQIQAGHLQDAIATLNTLRRLPSPLSEDPRIDLNEQWAVSTYDRLRQYELLESTARKATARGQKLLYARAKVSECTNLLFVGRPAEAIATCDEARSVFETLGDRAGVTKTLMLKAARQSDEGHHELSLQTLKQALQLARELGSSELVGSVLNGMGNTYERMNLLEEAARSFRDSRKKYKESGNKSGISATTGNLADVLASLGDLRAAEKTYEEALQIDESIAPARGCYSVYSIASLRLTMGDLKTARSHIESALKACAAQMIARENGFAIGVMGDILKSEGNLPGAREKYQEALEIYNKADAQDLIPSMKMNLALVVLEEGHTAEAEKSLRDLSASFEQRKDSDGASNALMLLSRALQLEGKPDDARKSLFRAEQLSRSVSDWTLKMSLVVQDARVKAATGSAPKMQSEAFAVARAHLQTVIAAARKQGNYTMECEAHLALGELELHSNPPVARVQLETLAKETHDRGFELVSRKATQLLSTTQALHRYLGR